MNNKSLKLAIAATAFIGAGAIAATNPAASGLTSTGSLDVTITKGDLVRISQLADINFPPTANMAADTSLGTNACVFSTLGGYNITATSPNALGPQLRLASGVNRVNYAIDFTDGTLATTTLTHGVNVTGFLGANPVDSLCFGGVNSNITATINAASFNAQPQGVYSDTVTLTFAPE
jgi:hypothetical protein